MPELIFVGRDTPRGESRRVRGRARAGELALVSRGIYTDELDNPEAAAARHWSEIIAHNFPGSVLGYRSALELDSAMHHVFITDPKVTSARKARYGALTVHISPGSGPQPGDTAHESFFIASPARALLENMTPSRKRDGVRRTLARDEIERVLLDCGAQGLKHHIESLRSAMVRLAPSLGLEGECAEMEKLMSVVLGETPGHLATDINVVLNARGEPYDHHWLECFEALAQGLQDAEVATPESLRAPDTTSRIVRTNAALIESWMSNYIEGTEFDLSEAEALTLRGRAPHTRSADSADVRGTFDLVADTYDCTRVYADFEQALSLLRRRHNHLMGHRPEVGPGELKGLANRAGSTRFVTPDKVRGTWRRGFALRQQLPSPLARAIFMHTLAVGVHPFLDGNGRASRITANAELSCAGECRFIIPTVLRGDYISAMKILYQRLDPHPLIDVIQRGQCFASLVPYAPTAFLGPVMHTLGAAQNPEDGSMRWPDSPQSQAVAEAVADIEHAGLAVVDAARGGRDWRVHPRVSAGLAGAESVFELGELYRQALSVEAAADIGEVLTERVQRAIPEAGLLSGLSLSPSD